MAGRPKKWRALRALFCDQIDEIARWNVVLELLRAGEVEVKKGMLCKKGEEEVAA